MSRALFSHLVLYCAIVLGLGMGRAHAATLDKLLASKVQTLESRYEERSRGILEEQLEPGSYLVTVKIDIDSAKIAKGIDQLKGVQLWTLSRRLTQDDLNEKFAEMQTPETLVSFIKRIRVKLALDKSIGDSVVKLVVSAIKDSLGMQKGRDKVTIARDKLGGSTTAKQQEKISQLENEKSRTVEEKRSLEIKLGSFETQKLQYEELVRQARAETERVRMDLQSAREETRTANDQIQKLKNQMTELEQNALSDNTFLGKIRKNIKGFELIVTIFPVAILVLLGLVILTLIYISSQGKRSKTMFQGMQVLAGALQSAGVIKNNQQSALNALTAKAAVARENTSAAEAQMPAVSDGVFELVKKEAEESWVQLKEKPYFLLAILKDLCASPEGANRFMAFCDAIGFAGAKEIWSQLTPQDIENASRYAAAGNPMSKDVALAVVPQLARQVEAQYAVRPPYFRQLDLNFLVGASDEALAEGIEKMPPEVVAFLLYSLTVERAGRVLSLLRGVEVGPFIESMAALENLQENDARRYVDTLKQGIKNDDRSKTKVGGHILSLFESAAPEQKNQIANALKSNASLSAEVGTRMVVIDDVFRLDAAVVGELISPLDSTQLAELVFSLPSYAQQMVSGLLTQKMIFDVQQEIARFRERPSAARKAQVNGYQLQQMLCEAVRAQVEQGIIVLPRRREQAS